MTDLLPPPQENATKGLLKSVVAWDVADSGSLADRQRARIDLHTAIEEWRAHGQWDDPDGQLEEWQAEYNACPAQYGHACECGWHSPTKGVPT